jgi:hypothetical protein
MFHIDVPGGHQVIQGAQTRVEFDVLKCPGDTKGSDFVRLKGGEIGLTIHYGASMGMIKSINAVEQAGLSSTIWSDNGKDFAIAYVEIYAIQGLHSAKGEGKIGNAEHNFICIVGH